MFRSKRNQFPVARNLRINASFEADSPQVHPIIKISTAGDFYYWVEGAAMFLFAEGKAKTASRGREKFA